MIDQGPLDARFEQALAALVLGERPPAKLMGMSDHSAVVVFPDHSYALLFRYIPGIDRGLGEHLRKVSSGLRAGRLTLALIGGGEDQQPLLTRAQTGWGIRRRVSAVQWKADGELWLGARTGAGHPLIAALNQAKAAARPMDPLSLHADLQAAADPNADGSHDLAAFARRLKQTQPKATWALVAICCLMYALTSLCGGADYTPSLMRAGANLGQRVLDGEWYRLAASVFLHGGLVHLVMNMIGLWFLGGFLERLMGPARMLILMFASGLAGSATSALLSPHTPSIGASGGLVGLFGATVVMAFIPLVKLPVPLVLQLRKNAVIILVINLAISMLPRVDQWAHLGGGLMGAALVASRLLTRGRDLAGLAEPDGEPTAKPQRPRWLAVAAVCLSIMMGVGLVQAQVEGRPWALVQAFELERVGIAPAGASIEIPAPILGRPAPVEGAEPYETEIGDPALDPIWMQIDIRAIHHDLSDPEVFEEQFQALFRARANEPVGKNLERLGKARIRELGGIQTIEEVIGSSRYGMRIWRYSQLRPGWVVTLQIEHLDEAPQAWKASVEPIAESIRTRG